MIGVAVVVSLVHSFVEEVLGLLIVRARKVEVRRNYSMEKFVARIICMFTHRGKMRRQRRVSWAYSSQRIRTKCWYMMSALRRIMTSRCFASAAYVTRARCLRPQTLGFLVHDDKPHGNDYALNSCALKGCARTLMHAEQDYGIRRQRFGRFSHACHRYEAEESGNQAAFNGC